MGSHWQKRTFLIVGLAVANILVCTVSAYSLHQSRNHYEQRAQGLTQSIAKALDQSVTNSIGRVDLALRSVADELERQLATGNGLDEAATRAFLARLEARLPEVEAFRIADAQGLVVLGKGVRKEDRVSWADRDYFIYHRDHDDRALQISTPRMGRVARQYIIGFAQRYNTPDGRFAGVVSAPIAVDHFTGLLSQLDLGPKGTLVLRYSDLGLITRFPPIPDQPAGQVGHTGVSAEFRQLAESGVRAATYHVTNSPDGFERVLTFRRLDGAPMIAIVGTASDDYLAPWYDEVRKTIPLALGFLVLSLLSGGGLVRMLARAEAREQALEASLENGRRQDEALRASEEKLRLLYELSPVGIALNDMEGRFLEFNEAFRRICGYPRQELLALDSQALTPGEFDALETQQRESLTRLGFYGPYEKEYQRRDGSRVPVRLNGVLVKASSGQSYIWSIVEDVSASRLAEQQLRAAKEAAEAANVAKSRFLATMSHEIRTPMNGILGMAQLLQMPDIADDDKQEYARIILESGHTLLALLNDILDLSKIEAGRVELEIVPFAPDQLLDEILTLFTEHAQSKGLALTADWQGPAAAHYRGDPIRLRQVLTNLASNAIKFTPRGFVRIEGREVERADDAVVLEFSVTDSGIGIPLDKQDLLFKPFSQVDASMTRRYGGTGLGLSIVHNLARLMDGEVGVDSREGEGTRIHFRVRVGAVLGECGETAERQPAVACPVHLPAGRVLVVEDNVTNRRVIEAHLERLRVPFETVGNGADAVQRLTLDDPPDVILMDYRMPVMDGCEATERIRRREREAGLPRTPIIALTAGAFAEDRERCLAAGMDDFLAKPVDLGELTAILGRFLGARATDEVAG